MAHTICKYPLMVSTTTINMPEGARPLYVGDQDRTLCLWAEVNPEAPLCKRTFQVYGTGHPLADTDRIYIGTVIFPLLVWHVYEEVDDEKA